jgi:hypothetical protein
MRKIQRLALRRPFRDVEESDIAKLLQGREVSQGSADLTGSYQCDLAARHVAPSLPLVSCTENSRPCAIQFEALMAKL